MLWGETTNVRKEEEVQGAEGSSTFCPRVLSHQVLQVFCWKLLHFLPQHSLNCPGALANRGAVVLSSPVTLFNGHPFYNPGYSYTPRHGGFSALGWSQPCQEAKDMATFTAACGRHQQAVG